MLFCLILAEVTKATDTDNDELWRQDQAKIIRLACTVSPAHREGTANKGEGSSPQPRPQSRFVAHAKGTQTDARLPQCLKRNKW